MIQGLSKMQQLRLDFVAFVDDTSALLEVETFSPTRTQLSYLCVPASTTDMELIAANMPDLRLLQLYANCVVTDEGLARVATACPQLEKLIAPLHAVADLSA